MPAVIELNVPADLDAELAEVAVEDGEFAAGADAAFKNIGSDDGDGVDLSVDASDFSGAVKEDGGVGIDWSLTAVLNKVQGRDEVGFVLLGQFTEGRLDGSGERLGALGRRAVG